MSESPKRVLILGGSGMAGSAIREQLKVEGYDVHWTYCSNKGYSAGTTAHAFCAGNTGDLRPNLQALCDAVQPHIVVNALLGKLLNFTVNVGVQVLLPLVTGAHTVYLSSNGVFSPDHEKAYREIDAPNTTTEYGIQKLAAEAHADTVVRMSIIGMSPSDPPAVQLDRYAKKLRNNLWNGVTNRTLALFIAKLLQRELPAKKVWHLCSAPIGWQTVVWLLFREYSIPYQELPTIHDVPLLMLEKLPPLLLQGYCWHEPLSTQISALQQPYRKYDSEKS